MLTLVTFIRSAKRRSATIKIKKILYGKKMYIRIYPPIILTDKQAVVEDKGTFYIEDGAKQIYREIGTYVQKVRKFIRAPQRAFIT